MMIEQKADVQNTAEEISRIFQRQVEEQFQQGRTTVAERRSKLSHLLHVVLKHREDIRGALHRDFRKHPAEVDLVEIYPIVSQIKHVRQHLSGWMSDHRVPTPLALMGSRSYIKYEPKGVVLIMSPWNFPLQLTLGPLALAIAAGNTVIIKPSEQTPHASAIIRKIVEEVFSEKEVYVAEGGIETATHLLSLPFNHIYFTGSTGVGKIVMTAAARHLASVTLELGGKSPTIVLASADVDMAARRIAWAKFLNNGQICIAPDHVFVHESKKAAFVQLVKKYIVQFYSGDIDKEPAYCRVVNDSHHERLRQLLEEAVNKGAKVEFGGMHDKDQRYFAPTLVVDVPLDTGLMREEIFGPILPVIGFNRVDDLIEGLNTRERPLALYIYGRNRREINRVLTDTRAGGSCINHNGLHFYNLYLPFGGVNQSGIGKGNGFHGFREFSNARAVLRQYVPNALDLVTPPFNAFKQTLINLTIKYF